MTATIPLTNSPLVAIVDAEDFPKLSIYKFRLVGEKRAQYPATTIKKRTFKIHRLILPTLPGTEIDHRDGNTLNNRKENLREVSHMENMWNRKKPSKFPTSSKYKGVHWAKDKLRWKSQITCKGKVYRLGSFKNEEQAARAYDEAALKHFGLMAALNFPRPMEVDERKDSPL